MVSPFHFFSQLPQKLGVTRTSDFYWVLFIYCCVNAGKGFGSTFTNIEVHNLHLFTPFLTSVDYAAGSVGGLLLYFCFPSLSKIFSLKKCVLVSLSVCVLASLLLILFLDTDVNFIVRFIFGIFSALFSISFSCYLADLFNGKHRTSLFGILCLIGSLSYATGPALIYAIDGIWQVYGLAALFFFLALMSSVYLSTPPKTQPTTSSPQKPLTSDKNVLSSIIFSVPILFLMCFLIGMGFSGEGKYFPIFAEGLGLIEGKAALLYSFCLLGSVITIPLVSYLADKYGFSKVLLGMSVGGTVLSVWATFTPSLTVITAIFFLISGVISSFSPITLAWVSERFGQTTALPFAMSLRSILGKIGSILSPLCIGFFMSHYGNNGFIYWLGLGFLSISSGTLIYLMRNKPVFKKNSGS